MVHKSLEVGMEDPVNYMKQRLVLDGGWKGEEWSFNL